MVESFAVTSLTGEVAGIGTVAAVSTEDLEEALLLGSTDGATGFTFTETCLDWVDSEASAATAMAA